MVSPARFTILALCFCHSMAALHRLQPPSSRVVHMAGQSTTEFGAYSSYLSSTTRPAGYTSYLQITELLEDSGKSARYLADMRSTLDALGDAEHVVLPHVSEPLADGTERHPQHEHRGRHQRALWMLGIIALLAVGAGRDKGGCGVVGARQCVNHQRRSKALGVFFTFKMGISVRQ